MSLSLREINVILDAYDSFEARRVDLKVSFENCGVKPFMAMCDLRDWKYCDEKIYGGIVLSIVRIIMME